MPWLSVVVPTYNRADYLGVCLTSLKEQSCPDWECLIVDDGSSDGSARVVDRFVSSDRRFRYQYQDNAGVSAARNAGLAQAQGEWVAFLDSDDFYFWQAVEQLRQASAVCEQQGVAAGIISGQHVVSRDQSPPAHSGLALSVRDLFFRVMNFSKKGRSPLLQSTIFHRSTLQAMEGGFSTDLATSEDREFLIRAAAAADVVLLETLVAHYRTDHGSGKSDHFRATGGKLQAHRQIYGNLDRSPVIRRRMAARGQQADFERLRQAYLEMLEAAALAAGGQADRAADRLDAAGRRCRNDEELEALVRAFNFFFMYPSSEPRAALRRSLQTLALVCAHLDRDSPARRTAEQLILQESGSFLRVGGRHNLVPERPAAGSASIVSAGLERPALRFAVRPMKLAPLPGGRALLHIPGAGNLVTDRHVAAAVQQCTTFRTLDQHVQMAAAHGRCALDRQQPLRQTLDELRVRGALLSVEQVFRHRAEPATTARPISVLAVELQEDLDRAAQTLQGHAENAALHGRRPAVLLIDPVEDEEAASCRARRLAEIAQRLGLSAHHAGPRERRALARLLARESELSEELVTLALVGSSERGASGNFNAMLLQTLGRSVMVVRAGSRCRPARLRDERPGLFITSSNGYHRTVAFDDRAALARALRSPDLDLLGVHERYLGASPEALAGTHPFTDIDDPGALLLADERTRPTYLAATLSSAYGALGDEDPVGLMLSRDSLDPRLLATPRLYRQTLRHEHVWKGVSEVTVGKIDTLDLRATALWNQPGVFPPLLPFLDHPETTFGWTAGTVNEQAGFAWLPVAVNVETEPPPEAEPASWRGIGFQDFSDLVEACLLTYERSPAANGSTARLVALGGHLCALARLPVGELLALIRPIVCSWIVRQMLFVEEMLEAHGGKPSHWADDARRHLDELVASLGRGPIATSRDDGFDLDQARTRLGTCGELLQAWPLLVQAADRVRQRGDSLLVGDRDGS
jgi:hypothetical protein